MKERGYLAYIEDMIEAIDKIIRYLETVNGLKGFLGNEMVIDAVTRNYEIIGEAANQIPKAIKDKHPEVPWRQMYGLRNFAAHEYHTIDPQILWEIAEDHLLENKIQLEEVLEKERDKER
ncbi:HepT-like ribonuclease domain-containing protein [Catalinimonas niigatensis]|uniref:HepT-like ribonuclease domain-containing protein n=1 Tax=Catalinimonas niigatensis TaxID=1397264 RepID=UPI00266656C3|nr:HepT-like ribonuclease domain-containing protein [Catalinimonas niigatensis]WPP51700.1 HepT-like ribonuclease domain-containing protein [Catalinimonas niigatensis]